tara:strand:- start:209 stop:595 length:387 start_codon:yes stop_codon:yes gene_type:complete
MVEWLNSLLDSIWEFIKLLWTVLMDAIGAFFMWIVDAFIWLVMIPVNIFKWIWEHTAQKLIDWAVEGFQNLSFDTYVEQINLGTWNVGGLLTALVDVNYVMTFSAGCALLLATVAFFKFAIKLIPGIG